MKRKIITIDGWSSCGKSTLAKQMDKTLGYVYIDSGAMYRAITLYFLRNNIEEAKRRLAKRSKYDVALIDQVIGLDEERRRIQTELDNTLAQTNSTSKQIGQLMAQGKRDDAEEMKLKVSELKTTIVPPLV